MNKKPILFLGAILLICTSIILLSANMPDPSIPPVNGQADGMFLNYPKVSGDGVHIPEGSILVDIREATIVFVEYPEWSGMSGPAGEGTVFVSLNGYVRNIEGVSWKLAEADDILYVWR